MLLLPRTKLRILTRNCVYCCLGRSRVYAKYITAQATLHSGRVSCKFQSFHSNKLQQPSRIHATNILGNVLLRYQCLPYWQRNEQSWDIVSSVCRNLGTRVCIRRPFEEKSINGEPLSGGCVTRSDSKRSFLKEKNRRESLPSATRR